MQVSKEEPPHLDTPDIRHDDSPQSAHRILIVDDETTLRFGFSIALSTEGHEVEEAEDGEAAIRAITAAGEDHGFDAMVLDLRMPGKSGIDVLRELGEQGIVVPTVIVSAYIDSPTAVEAIEWGAVDFLQKPTKPDELRGVVNHLVTEESAFGDGQAKADPPADDIADTIARVRWNLRRRHWDLAFDLFASIAPDEVAGDGPCRLQLSLWRLIVSHLKRREELGGKTEFASSRFYEATDLLKFLAYNSE